MNSDINKRLKNFLEDYSEVEITEDTPLFVSLELIGDDAYFFILKFEQEFKVDFRTFDFSKYFHPESRIPFKYWFLRKYRPKQFKKCQFNLNHLVQVIEKGKWFDPE